MVLQCSSMELKAHEIADILFAATTHQANCLWPKHKDLFDLVVDINRIVVLPCFSELRDSAVFQHHLTEGIHCRFVQFA